MKSSKLNSAGHVIDGSIAAIQLFLAGFFAWQPALYSVMLLWASQLPLAVVPVLLMSLCVLVIVTFSVLFAARAFRSREVTNLARIMAIINSFVLFLFGGFTVISLGGSGIVGFLFFLMVIMTWIFIPVAIVSAVLAAVGCISLLLARKKS